MSGEKEVIYISSRGTFKSSLIREEFIKWLKEVFPNDKLVKREDLEWLFSCAEKRVWHDGNKHTKEKLQDIRNISRRRRKLSEDPFSPDFDHSKCYFWCGNPYCDSKPLDEEEDTKE